MNEEFLEVLKGSERMYNLYRIGPVQRAEIEDFVNEIVHVINNAYDCDTFSDFLLRENLIFDR